MVNVLPDPVTPSSTWHLSPRRSPSTSSGIARAWSPRSSKSVTRLNLSKTEGIFRSAATDDRTTGVRFLVRGAGGLSTRREVALSRPDDQTTEPRPSHRDDHSPPLPVVCRIGRDITERILCMHLVGDAAIHCVELFHHA